MKVVNINKVLVIGIISLILVNFSALIYQKYTDKETNIPKVKLKDQEKKKDTFAIMLEQDDGTYQATESTSFDQPGYKFNSEKSGCIDINGNKIENALSYNETAKAVVVNVDSTSYCYVYFDLKPSDGANQLIESGELWESGLEGDGYRYVGNNTDSIPDNYICFGTTDKDTCIGNTDAYMYRIIGVFPDSEGNQHMKLIKKEALNTEFTWHSDAYSDVDWVNSRLYKQLNDTEAGSTVYLKNSIYMPADGTKNWSDRITNWTWSAVNTLTEESSGPNYRSLSPANIYLHELNRTGKTNVAGEWTTPSAKIGLMYASDYVLSLGSIAINMTTGTYTNKETLKTGWMHLSNNDSNPPTKTYEATMSRYGRMSSDAYFAWFVEGYGDLSGYTLIDAWRCAARPVFYLNYDQTISSGSGTIDNPFILS